MLEIRRFGGLSPCNGICSYDQNDQYCVGCYRTKHEIETWHQLNEKERKDVTMELGRRAVHIKNKLKK
jgi:hypothetical protein